VTARTPRSRIELLFCQHRHYAAASKTARALSSLPSTEADINANEASTMPTHNSSPHRFLAPGRPSAQKPKPKPPSTLRNSFTNQTPKPALPTQAEPETPAKYATPAKRFVIAPHRRTHSSEANIPAQVREVEARLDPHTQLTPRPKPRRKFERVESIEETSQSSPPAALEGDNGFGIVQTMEHDGMFGIEEAPHEQDDEEDEILFVSEERNKRRRVSPPSPPSSHGVTEPTTPSAPHNSTTHRFVVPPPRTPALFSSLNDHLSTEPSKSTATPTPASHRPAFILPPQPTSPVKPSKPLPEIFSPSRKTQKYVPNGLASTLQGWIIETANTGFAAQERSTTGGVVWGRNKEDGVRLKVRVKAASSSTSRDGAEVECFPGLFVFVRGETEPGTYNVSRASDIVGNDGETRVLLAGQGGARGTGGVKVKVGGVVGIRAPTWDVDVGGEKWVVGMDWVVL
jgi:hypothetical protein